MKRVFVCLLAAASMALAANDVSWVATTGNDANPCTRTQPCRGVDAAISATKVAGEVHFVDSGEYAGFAMPKAVTVDGAGVAAVIRPSGGFGYAAVVQGSMAGAEVNLRNLIMMPSSDASTSGNFTDVVRIFPNDWVVANLENIEITSPVGRLNIVGIVGFNASLHLRNVRITGGKYGLGPGYRASRWIA